jgi:glycosyltransferase involved in cell wall biosynthesis
MSEAPRLSVVILAYNRRQYLKGAVASALDQTLPRDRFEVLVFKNFDDPEIDEYLNAHGVRNITSPPSARPRTMRVVLEHARGEVLCLMDDDDLYTRDKLAFVDRAFTEDPSLGYLHNEYYVIDDSGKPFGHSPFPHLDQRVYIPAGDGRSRPLPGNALELGFNSSCVSVRRDWLGPYLEAFDRREAEWSDRILLCAALLSGRAVLADTSKLTRYRYHDSWSNVLHYSAETVGRVAEMDAQNIAVNQLIQQLSSGSPLEPWMREDITYVRFHRYLFAQPVDWTPRPQDFFDFLFSSIRRRNPAASYLLPLYFVSQVSRAGARKMYFDLASVFRQISFR